MRREERRKNRLNLQRYVIDPDTNEVQVTFGKPKPKPKAVIYLPHYENSLRIEIDIPKGKTPDDIQRELDDYKDKFVDWFGGNKKRGYTWGNKTRRYVYNKIALKIEGIKIPTEENRALRTLFMYKGILTQFGKGKTRKEIVYELETRKKFEFEQVRKMNKYSRKTGIILKTTRKASTINRDISSLVKVGLIRRIGKGRYEVVKDKEFGIESADRLIFHKSKK